MTDPVLSEHFSFSEMTRTKRTSLQELNRASATAFVIPLSVLCTTILEPIRAHFGRPVAITSGYRCPELNKAIGGSKTSQHMKGEAADFAIPGVTLEAVRTWIWTSSGLPYGQVLLEAYEGQPPTWVHVSLGPPWRSVATSKQHFVVRDA